MGRRRLLESGGNRGAGFGGANRFEMPSISAAGVASVFPPVAALLATVGALQSSAPGPSSTPKTCPAGQGGPRLPPPNSPTGGDDPPDDPCKGLRRQLNAHWQKLTNYMRNPHAFDNQGLLGKGYDKEVIQGRMWSLARQITNFQRLLEECERKHGL